jgi:hypothetical protein
MFAACWWQRFRPPAGIPARSEHRSGGIYDKLDRRIEVSATITEAIADALENAKDLPEEVSNVAQRDIAGAGFEPATFGL